MIRDLTRFFLRLGLLVLILWGFIQSCSWMGKMSTRHDNYNGYPYYGRSPYNSSHSSTYQSSPTNYDNTNDSNDLY